MPKWAEANGPEKQCKRNQFVTFTNNCDNEQIITPHAYVTLFFMPSILHAGPFERYVSFNMLFVFSPCLIFFLSGSVFFLFQNFLVRSFIHLGLWLGENWSSTIIIVCPWLCLTMISSPNVQLTRPDWHTHTRKKQPLSAKVIIKLVLLSVIFSIYTYSAWWQWRYSRKKGVHRRTRHPW